MCINRTQSRLYLGFLIKSLDLSVKINLWQFLLFVPHLIQKRVSCFCWSLMLDGRFPIWRTLISRNPKLSLFKFGLSRLGFIQVTSSKEWRHCVPFVSQSWLFLLEFKLSDVFASFKPFMVHYSINMPSSVHDKLVLYWFRVKSICISVLSIDILNHLSLMLRSIGILILCHINIPLTIWMSNWKRNNIMVFLRSLKQ